MCQIATIQSSEDNVINKMSPNDYTMGTTGYENHHHRHRRHHHHPMDEQDFSIDMRSNTKYFVDLYTAALHLR